MFTDYINKMNQNNFDDWYDRVEVVAKRKYDFDISLLDDKVDFRSYFNAHKSARETVEILVNQYI